MKSIIVVADDDIVFVVMKAYDNLHRPRTFFKVVLNFLAHIRR